MMVILLVEFARHNLLAALIMSSGVSLCVCVCVCVFVCVRVCVRVYASAA